MRKQFILIKHGNFTPESVDTIPYYELMQYYGIYNEYLEETKKATKE